MAKLIVSLMKEFDLPNWKNRKIKLINFTIEEPKGWRGYKRRII